jgi:uncharacterized protein YjbI with pentapeptide repeats
MFRKVLTFIEKHLNTLAIALLAPLGGLWISYMQEARQTTQLQRQWTEQLEAKHEEFAKEISTLLMRNELDFIVNSSNRLEAEIIANELVPLLTKLGPDSGYSQQEIERYQSIPNQHQKLNPQQRALFTLLTVRLQNLIRTGRTGKADSEQETREASAKIKETLEFLHGLELLSGSISLLGLMNLNNLDLSGVKLSCLKMNGTTVSNTRLESAELPYSHIVGQLDRVSLRSAGLRSSRIWGIIRDVNFEKANLSRVILENATIYASSFRDAEMMQANLFNADLHASSSFRGADLRGADLRVKNHEKGLEGLFQGGYANTEPIEVEDGDIIPTTILPTGHSLASLGLIQWNRKELPPSIGEDRRYTSNQLFLLHESCSWREEVFDKLTELGRKR